jgi:hypothetical protein
MPRSSDAARLAEAQQILGEIHQIRPAVLKSSHKSLTGLYVCHTHGPVMVRYDTENLREQTTQCPNAELRQGPCEHMAAKLERCNDTFNIITEYSDLKVLHQVLYYLRYRRQVLGDPMPYSVWAQATEHGRDADGLPTYEVPF